MDFADVIESYKAEAIATEAARAVSCGFAAGIVMTGVAGVASLLGFGFGGIVWSAVAAVGMLAGPAIYITNFGLFSSTRVAARLTRKGVDCAPEVSFGRMDALLRRMWMFSWMFGAIEGVSIFALAG